MLIRWHARSRASAARFLDAEPRRQHEAAQAALQARLFALISEFGACSNCLATSASNEDATVFVDLPIRNLSLDDGKVALLDLEDYTQVDRLCALADTSPLPISFLYACLSLVHRPLIVRA